MSTFTDTMSISYLLARLSTEDIRNLLRVSVERDHTERLAKAKGQYHTAEEVEQQIHELSQHIRDLKHNSSSKAEISTAVDTLITLKAILSDMPGKQV